jgi:hypothetical protein
MLPLDQVAAGITREWHIAHMATGSRCSPRATSPSADARAACAGVCGAIGRASAATVAMKATALGYEWQRESEGSTCARGRRAWR